MPGPAGCGNHVPVRFIPKKGTHMKSSRILLAAVVSAAAFAAQAQSGGGGGEPVSANPLGQGAKASSQAPNRPAWATKNVWSTSYNPLIGFQSAKSREQVRAELMSGRQALLAHERRNG
jgi:hypothetical protein